MIRSRDRRSRAPRAGRSSPSLPGKLPAVPRGRQPPNRLLAEDSAAPRPCVSAPSRWPPHLSTGTRRLGCGAVPGRSALSSASSEMLAAAPVRHPPPARPAVPRLPPLTPGRLRRSYWTHARLLQFISTGHCGHRSGSDTVMRRCGAAYRAFTRKCVPFLHSAVHCDLPPFRRCASL